MPNFRHGALTRVFMSQMDASPFLNSAEVSQTIDTAETSAFGSRAKSYIPGKRDATMSIGGMYDGTLEQLDEVMNNLHVNDTTYPITLFYDGGVQAGRVCRMGEVFQTSYDVNTPVDDVVGISGELQCNGGVIFGLVHNGETPVTDTVVTGTTRDWGALSATTKGGVMHVHVPANTRSTATSVVVQTSVDNSIWTDLLTQNVPAGTTAGYTVSVATGAVPRYTRALITPAAGTGSAVIIVAFGRN